MVVKIGIMSDLHMRDNLSWDFEPEEGVFYICAGDISEDDNSRHRWVQKHADHMFAINGNHDYYGASFSDVYMHLHTKTVGDIKIAGATLWTDLSKHIDWVYYVNGLIDKRYIHDLNQEDMVATHDYHKKFLLTSEADIIVSHHTPSLRSIHPRYENSPYNPSFSNDMEEDILLMKKPPKIWIHGHTHNRFDYMIGETRVICHPRGYKNELDDYMNYKPLIVEI
jgi:predicted phosphodiesterase